MEKRNLPNATAVLILGIISILTCCCGGLGIGVIAGIVALVLAKKDLKLYNENPDLYLNYPTLNTGRILAIIGTTLSAITFLINVYIEVSMSDKEKEAFMQNLKDKMEQMEKEKQ